MRNVTIPLFLQEERLHVQIAQVIQIVLKARTDVIYAKPDTFWMTVLGKGSVR